MNHTTAYRLAAAVALGTALLLIWGIGALGVVGQEGDSFDLIYFAVLAVGIVGALIARFRAEGMARAMFAMALGLAVVAVVALVAGKQHSTGSSVLEILGLTCFFAAPFVVSGLLFLYAAREEPRVSAARKG